MTTVIALGGNALMREDDRGTAAEQHRTRLEGENSPAGAAQALKANSLAISAAVLNDQ